MPGNSVIRDKTNERHGLFWGIESCDVTHYSAPTARRQHSESRYGTEQGSPRITLGSLCQELQHRCNVMVEIMHPVDHEVQSLYHFITESLSGVSGFLCLGRLFQGQPNEAALCI